MLESVTDAIEVLSDLKKTGDQIVAQLPWF